MNDHIHHIEDLWRLCPEIQSIMVGKDLPRREGKLQDNGSASTANNLLIIANLILDLKSQRTLETGMANGTSALAFLIAKQYAGVNEDIHICIDPFQQLHYGDCGVMAVERAGLTKRMEVRYNYSSIELPRLLEAAASFELIYVDGSHLFEDAFLDAYFAVRLLCKNGVVLFDDSVDPHVRKVVNFLRTNLSDSVCEMDLSRWRGDNGRSWRYRVGRRLGRLQLTGFRKTGDVARNYGSPLVRF